MLDPWWDELENDRLHQVARAIAVRKALDGEWLTPQEAGRAEFRFGGNVGWEYGWLRSIFTKRVFRLKEALREY